MKNLELKRCPFCGCEAVTHDCGTFENEKLSVIFDGRVGVHCSECHIATPPYDNEEEAVKAWNKRHSSVTVNQYGKNCTNIKNDGHITIEL